MEEKAIDTIDRQTWLVVKSVLEPKSDLKYPSLHLPTMGPPTFHEPSDNCVTRNKA